MGKLTDDQIKACVEQLGRDGYTHVPGYLSLDETAAIRALLEQQITAMHGVMYPGYSEFRPEDEQVFNLQSKDIGFIRLLTEESLEKLLMAKLNDAGYRAIPQDQPNYILGEYIARSSGEALRLHIDSWMPSPGEQTWMIQVVFVLDDRSEEAGCTTVVPGTHRSGQYADRGYQDVQTLPAKAGDLVLWDSRLWHGALANKLPQKSWVLVATVQCWWVKQRFDIPRTIGPELYGVLSDKEKALLGFCAMPPASELLGTDTRGGYDRLPEKSLV